MTRAALAVLALAAASSAGAEVRAGDLTVSGAQIRAVAPGVANTAGYLTIANGGARADRLVSASCTCARSVEIHISHVMNGMAMMMPLAPVEIPAHGSAVFKPGDLHLMVMGLKAPLKDGSAQQMTLKFEHAGALSVPFEVKAKIGG